MRSEFRIYQGEINHDNFIMAEYSHDKAEALIEECRACDEIEKESYNYYITETCPYCGDEILVESFPIGEKSFFSYLQCDCELAVADRDYDSNSDNDRRLYESL